MSRVSACSWGVRSVLPVPKQRRSCSWCIASSSPQTGRVICLRARVRAGVRACVCPFVCGGMAGESTNLSCVVCVYCRMRDATRGPCVCVCAPACGAFVARLRTLGCVHCAVPSRGALLVPRLSRGAPFLAADQTGGAEARGALGARSLCPATAVRQSARVSLGALRNSCRLRKPTTRVFARRPDA